MMTELEKQYDLFEKQAEMVLANIRNAVANGELAFAEEERKTYNVIRRKIAELERRLESE